MDPTGSSEIDNRGTKRIALVGPSHPYRGGIAHFVDSLNDEMRIRGHHTMRISFRRQYPAMLFPGESQFEDDESEERAVAETAVRVLDSINPLSWREAVSIIQRDQSQLVVLNYWMPFFAPMTGTLARRLRRVGVKVIVVVHNALPHESHLGAPALTRYVLNAADKLISLSNEVQTQLLERFGKQSIVVPHPVYDRFGVAPQKSVAREAIEVPQEAKVILFFGFIRRYKGLDILIDALPKIVQELPDAFVVVAGEFYDNRQPYRDAVARLGVSAHIRFEDRYIPSDLVPAYFAAADVVVQPYRSATQSGVAQIAFNYERPVITTNVGGLSEIVENDVNGIVVSAPEPALVAQAVIQFFRTGAAERMSAAIADERGRRSWSLVVDEIERS